MPKDADTKDQAPILTPEPEVEASEEVVEAEAVEETVSVDTAPKESDVLIALREMTAMMVALGERVNSLQDRVDTQAPRFQPMEFPDLGPQPINLKNLSPEERERTGAYVLPSGINGTALDPQLLRVIHNPHPPGAQVRIRRDAVVHGSEGVTWGQVIDRINLRAPVPCTGIGTVKKAPYFATSMQWKYIVTVPGLTNKAGDGFLDYEIERIS